MIDLSSRRWSDALCDGLGAQHRALDDGGSVTCFKAGPFRLAYPDFITGTPAGASADAIAMRIETARLMGADMLRLQTEGRQPWPTSLAAHEIHSVVIPSLMDWDEKKIEKCRRTANRIKRSSIALRPGREQDAAAMHQLYLATVRRHGGAARYSQQYFGKIAAASATVAELEGAICGFVCTGFSGQRGYYLHGAHSADSRQHYVSDILFLSMLREAHGRGLASFDFLASPANQPSLGAYKRLWGGIDRNDVSSDIALNAFRAFGLSTAIKLSNFLHRFRPRI